MGTHVRLLQGEVDDSAELQSGQNRDVEAILAGFLRSLLEEEGEFNPPAPRIHPPTGNEIPLP